MTSISTVIFCVHKITVSCTVYTHLKIYKYSFNNLYIMLLRYCMYLVFWILTLKSKTSLLKATTWSYVRISWIHVAGITHYNIPSILLIEKGKRKMLEKFKYVFYYKSKLREVELILLGRCGYRWTIVLRKLDWLLSTPSPTNQEASDGYD